jgi:hypothetical protein
MNTTTLDPARTAAADKAAASHAAPSVPWYRVGMVWLVLSGPAVVVVAGISTAVIAHKGADRVVRTPTVIEAAPSAELPAVQGRNHAATPR